MRLVPILLALLAAPLNAADLPSVVAAALSRSPALAGARARAREARAAGDEAWYGRLPRLSARASATRGDDPLFAFGSLLQERRVTSADFAPDTLNRPGYQTAVHGALELGVPLFTGFALTRARELARLGAEEADAFGGAAAQAVRLRAADGYFKGLKDRELLAVLDEAVASSEKEVESAERLKKQGLVLGSDHQAALAILSGLKAWRVRTAAEENAHDAELSVLTGGPADPAGALRDWTPPVEDDAALVAAALASRADLRAAGLRAARAGVVERGAAQSLLPTVDAFAAVETSADGLNAGAASRMLGVRASMPFGDPAYLARRGRAKAGADAAGDARAELEDAARAEVLGRAAGVRGLIAALPDLDESLARAQESLAQVRPLYREGRQSVMEVLRAEEAVARLQDARLDALCRLRSEWAALRAAQGRLDDAAVGTLASSLETPR
ncbi:MAG: TolC family protein [Elusimicrobia bacterium]|nr:TolC family protein [Elusimicrobiota bacterium]